MIAAVARRLGSNGGRIAPLLIALAVAAPIAFVLASLAAPRGAVLAHVWATTGPVYLAGTLALCLMVGIGAAVIGVAAAALVALTDFPGRRILSPALALPFAVPAYIGAYAYADLLAPFGPVAQALGPGAVEIRSLPGAAFILTLAVYPYVYLAARASFASRSGAQIEAARTLGLGPLQGALRTLVPAGRAAIAGGLALALMETIADYGVADYFGVATLSVGIFRTWHGLGDLAAASQLAAGLFLVALVLVVFEESARRGLAADSARAGAGARRIRLAPPAAMAATVFCLTPVVLGFGVPVGVLVARLPDAGGIADLLRATANTAAAAALGASLAMAGAFALATAARPAKARASRRAARVATLGYALPGAVVAIGVLSLADRTASFFIAGSLAALAYAYAVRFMTAGYNAVDGGMKQIHPLTDDAARVLGAGALGLATRVHWPLIGPSFAAGALIVLIDIARELPATLILRPFDFETLATRVWRLASDERLADAAPAALLLIALSLAPVLLLDAFAGEGRFLPPLEKKG